MKSLAADFIQPGFNPAAGGHVQARNRFWPIFTYNWVGLNRYTVSGKQPVPAGKATIRFEFTTDGGKSDAGGTGVILVNGAKVATGRNRKYQRPYVLGG